MRHQHAFDLPQESLDVTPARAATAGQLRGLTMLVAEDDSDARYIFRRMLTLERTVANQPGLTVVSPR